MRLRLAQSLPILDSEDHCSLPRALPEESGVAEPGSPPPLGEARPAASETHRPDNGRRRPSAAIAARGPGSGKLGTAMTYTFKLSRRLAANDPSWRGWFASLLLLTTACGAGSSTGPSDGTQPPVTAVPGWLTVQLTDPHHDDGALQLRVSGPAIDSIVADARYDGYGAAANGVADLVVAGSIVTGNVARFRVADVNQATAYTVSIVAAVQNDTYALRSTSGYRAVIVR